MTPATVPFWPSGADADFIFWFVVQALSGADARLSHCSAALYSRLRVVFFKPVLTTLRALAKAPRTKQKGFRVSSLSRALRSCGDPPN